MKKYPASVWVQTIVLFLLFLFSAAVIIGVINPVTMGAVGMFAPMAIFLFSAWLAYSIPRKHYNKKTNAGG